MTAIIRNTLLAFVAASALAGSAAAGQSPAKMECGNTSTNKPWAGRCCGLGGDTCLGGGGNGQSHGSDRGGGRQR
jgi:hypothetical protein